MRHRITVLLGVLLWAGACTTDDPAGPEGPVLVGQFGSATEGVVLLATRAGVELDEPCWSYFVSEAPLVFAADGSFRVRGQAGHADHPETGAASLFGRVTSAGGVVTVMVTLTSDEAEPPVERFSIELTENTLYSGPPIGCAL